MPDKLLDLIGGGGIPAVCATLLIALLLVLRELRLRRAKATSLRPPPALAPAPSATPSRPSLHATRRVLVVEDEPAQARVYQRWLRELEAVEVDVVWSGEDALAMVRAEPFDLLLVDVGLTGMPGPELVRRLREEGSMRPLVHVVILSGLAGDALAEIARQCGASAWLEKPVERERLIEVAAHLLGRALPVGE